MNFNNAPRKRIEMSAFDKMYLSKLDTHIDSITLNNKQFYLKKVISVEGFKSVVWQATDKYNNTYALKFATFEDYVDRSFEEEMIKASKINRYTQFARIESAAIKEFKHNRKIIKCVVFSEEWIEGVNIEKIDNELVTIPFILKYIEKFCNVLNILKHLKLRHDDLHLQNVLVVKSPPGSLIDDLDLKVIDMGSLKDYHTQLKPVKKGIDDLKNLSIHLSSLLNKLLFLNSGSRRMLSNNEKVFINDSIKILNSIVDNDTTRAITSPFYINQAFQNTYLKIFQPTKKSKLILNDPFDYITAEQISDDKLLIELFAESCPWINDIISPNPILLTGPRGCGKSMLFRRFSLKALLSVDDKLIDEIQIVGFYISCSADLSNRYSIITTRAQAIAYKEEIVHYFNLVLLREILSTLKAIIERTDRNSKFGINENLEKEIFSFVTKKLKILNDKKLKLQGINPLAHLFELVKFEANATFQSILERSKIRTFTSFNFIAEITSFLSSKIPYFIDRKITFLIDDYSLHRIPGHVQEFLNQVIWDRQGSHIFKVSSEKYGTIQYMYNNTSADLSREYTEIDIGRNYINLSESTKTLKRFSSDLLNHRLRLAGFVGTAEILISNSEYGEGTLGRQIFSKNNSNEFYHGIETISQVCSGDISTLLEIYRNIFKEGHVGKLTNNFIEKSIQHKGITSSSKNFLDLTKHFHPYGHEMYRIVLYFGNLCKRILTEGRLQNESRGNRSVPNETSRIEIEEAEFSEQFSDLNENIYKELIRRAIFIELETSRGRHTLGITSRLQMRRIYCPSFGLSLSKNTAIKWSQSEFKAFLNDPESKCEMEFDSRWRKDNTIQQDLFNGV